MKTAHDLDEMLARHEEVFGSWRNDPTKIGKPIKADPDEVEARRVLVRKYTEQGYSQVEIAETISANKHTILDDQRAMGIEPQGTKRGEAGRARAAERKAIAADFLAGMTIDELIEKYGVKRAAIRDRLLKEGIHVDGRRTALDIKANSVTATAMIEMAKYANLVLQQDLSTLDLSDEDRRSWEKAARTIAAAVSYVRRNMKGKQ